MAPHNPLKKNLSDFMGLRGGLFTSFLGLVWIFICQFTFLTVQSNQGRALTTALQAQFKSDLFKSDFEYLARSVGELETIGVVRCPKVQEILPRQQLVLDLSFKGGCISRPWLLGGGAFSAMAQASNGDQYELEFSTANDLGFYIGLWSMRAGGIILLIALNVFFRSRSVRLFEAAELKMQAAEAISKLASQVAHDIRSPLAVLEVALSSEAGISAENRRLLGGAASRIRDIANDLLNRNAVSADSGNLSKIDRIQISSVVVELIAEKRVQFSKQDKIVIESKLSEGASELCVRASEVAFKRVLSNLVNNSIEAMASGIVSISVDREGDWVVICVRDSGKGIPREILDRVTEPGFSFGKSNRESGSGLGLSHAKAAIEEMGGKLAISSEPGVGTVVTLKLQLVNSPMEFQFGSEQIVLIDNDPSIRDLWARTARKRNLEFASYGDFASLSRNLENISTNALIFVDMELGEHAKSGADVARYLLGRGYLNLFLTTGRRNVGLADLSYFKGIIGKEPPWV